MKKTEKLSILISIILVSLLTISAVSATDNDTNIIGDDSLTPNGDDTQTPGEKDLTPTHGYKPENPGEKPEVSAEAGTFEDLKSNITDAQVNKNGKLELKSDYKNTDPSNHGIKITKTTDCDNLTIEGNHHLIDANGYGRIFEIDADMNVTLKNLIFVNGKIDGQGGAITNKGTLTLINVAFTNNTATLGGAIDSENYLNITNASFFENSANGAWGSGGAIINGYGHLIINNAVFGNNNATGDGGAIYLYTEPEDQNANLIISINDTIFGDNAVLNTWSKGGAIWANHCKLNINNTQFIKNSAPNSGGAIYSSADLNIENFLFYGNKVNGNDAQEEITGGAICIEVPQTATAGEFKLTVTINKGIFSKNSANSTALNKGYGGAIAIANPFWESPLWTYQNVTVNIKDTDFVNNTAITFGGAIYNKAFKTDIIRSTFTSNYAKSGGAIYNDNPLNISESGNITTIAGSNFTENEAEYGGAIYNKAGKILLTKNNNDLSIFQDNKAMTANEILNYYNEANPTSYTEIGEAIITTEDDYDPAREYPITIFDQKDLYGNFYVTNNAKFPVHINISAKIVNNETGSVAISIKITSVNDPKTVFYGEPIRVILIKDGELINEYELSIGEILYPEVDINDLTNGTYLIEIIHEDSAVGLYKYTEFYFNVVNTTAIIKELKDTNDKLNITNQELKDINNKLNEKVVNLTNETQNLTTENTKLKEDLDKANKNLANKTNEAANLQNQLITTQNQLKDAQNQLIAANNKANDADTKIKKVKAASKIKKSKNFKITVTLKKAVKGKYVFVAFNGKTYKAKTNSKGVAKITIKKSALKKLGGKKIKYQVIYNQSIKNKTVKIKK